MANNHSNQISGSSNAYDPNDLTIFPDLLQPLDLNVVPAIHPQRFRGQNARRIVNVVRQEIYHYGPNNELLAVQQGPPAPSPTFNSIPAGYWTLPGPTSNINNPVGSWPFVRQTMDFHAAGRTVLRPTPNIIRPARRVPRRRRSAASSRAQLIPDTDAPSRCVQENLGAPVAPRQEPRVHEPEARENNFNCAICMNPFVEPTAANCGHVFCRSCINQAFGLRRQCPICRRTITRRGLSRIYL